MAKRGPKGPTSSSFKKGQIANPNGRPVGAQNKATTEFKTAVKLLMDSKAGKFDEWIDRIAETNPARAMEVIGQLGEFVVPKQSRVTHVGEQGAPILYTRVVDDIRDQPDGTDQADK